MHVHAHVAAYILTPACTYSYICADIHTFIHTYIHTYTHTQIHIQPGYGLWTCSVCGRDGPAVVLSRPNKCRACAATCALMGRDEYGAIPQHVCHDCSHIVKAFASKGIPAEALYLHDFGKYQASMGWRMWSAVEGSQSNHDWCYQHSVTAGHYRIKGGSFDAL